MACVGRSKKIWQDFKQDFDNSDLQTFLKHSYPVLCCPSGQCNLDASDHCSMAAWSPESFVPNQESAALIEHVRVLNHIRREFERRGSRDLEVKKELGAARDQLDNFDPSLLEFQEHRLEARFSYLNMSFIQQIKKSRFVDRERTWGSIASIRVVLRTD